MATKHNVCRFISVALGDRVVEGVAVCWNKHSHDAIRVCFNNGPGAPMAIWFYRNDEDVFVSNVHNNWTLALSPGDREYFEDIFEEAR